MTAYERTGWRDAELSALHREWGVNAPANDIDLPLIEYDQGKVMALVDYKHERALWPVDRKHGNIRAFVDLADRECRNCGTKQRIPAFACRYGKDPWWFEPDPLNEIAMVWVPEPRRFDELGWVELLYGMRARRVPDDVLRAIALRRRAA